MTEVNEHAEQFIVIVIHRLYLNIEYMTRLLLFTVTVVSADRLLAVITDPIVMFLQL